MKQPDHSGVLPINVTHKENNWGLFFKNIFSNQMGFFLHTVSKAAANY